MEEGVAGLDEKPRTRKVPRKVTLKIANEVRKLQENPLLGKWRMSAALSRMRIARQPDNLWPYHGSKPAALRSGEAPTRST